MHRNRIHECLWCYVLEYTAQIRERMARPTVADCTTIEHVTGDTPDISEWIDFPIYG